MFNKTFVFMVCVASMGICFTNDSFGRVMPSETFNYEYNNYNQNGYPQYNGLNNSYNYVVPTTYQIQTETPVQSYYAYPDDVNFIPETEFMNRDTYIDYDRNIDCARNSELQFNSGVMFAGRPMVICRNFSCTRLNDRITRTFLFNNITNMFLMNGYSRLYICEADPFSRDCLKSGITFPVRSGIANALVKIPSATISQTLLSPGMSQATIGMTPEFLVNGIQRQCEQTVMDVVIPVNSQATLTTREFSCNLTSDGISSVSLIINLDYIDLDYGILGGYYSIGMQGPTSGGGTGYALFKTEYSNRGMKFMPNTEQQTTNGVYSAEQDMGIRPGEYKVLPLRNK